MIRDATSTTVDELAILRVVRSCGVSRSRERLLCHIKVLLLAMSLRC